MTGRTANRTGPAERRRGGTAGRWWGRTWLAAVEERALLDPNRLPRAARYARSGAVADLAFEPGLVIATVAGRGDCRYDVRVRVRPFDDVQWGRVLDVLGSQAGHAAALVGGQISVEVAAELAGAGTSLLPRPGEIGPRCTCPDDADPCKHSAAVCFLIADALDADPSLALLLRGRGRAEVLSGIRSRRRHLSELEPSPREPGGGKAAREASVGTAADGTAAAREIAGPVDPGLDARAVLSRRDRPPVPSPPRPPQRPGRPTAWSFEPPQHLAELRSDLVALAADASRRAWELAVGASPDGGLGLDRDADLARRANRALGTPVFAALASTSGVGERDLARWALAWRHGGATGFDTLRTRWDPSRDGAARDGAARHGAAREGAAPGGEAGARHLVAAARTALHAATGQPAVIRGDRVTSGDRQLRLGRDFRWYPYHRIRGHWEPAGPPAPDSTVPVSHPAPPAEGFGVSEYPSST